MILERFISWLAGRVLMPEWLFNWMLRRKFERKGYRW